MTPTEPGTPPPRAAATSPPTGPGAAGHPGQGVRNASSIRARAARVSARAEWERLVVRGGLRAELGLRDGDFGQRHFIVAAPDGVLIDVITPVPPSADWADRYVEA
ncbi:hypothetical protein [Micromonospora peucetia]|uniref:Glyoxalase n=1 Tax=Micromonospora peucetia TaxID=47871 RepID=A0ABZ1E891_9ACTN|nr:hypothetical protein [Micromonospora peucetia]WSA30692.1 hypothetical protein OIE14_21265 [Micromonospora peucetia]